VLRTTAIDSTQLNDKAKVQETADAIEAYLNSHYEDMLPIQVNVGWDAEHDAGTITVIPEIRVRGRDSVINWELLQSSEYQEALNAQRDLMSIGKPPYLARSGEAEARLEHAQALTEFLEERGRRGVAVSRYKGLGEMNAEELWETTMNPDARVLRQVRIDDAMGSDELFSILMGDQVEPRRNFIETHALQVQNLDI
jgi:DNA gyrase subunit B